MRIDRPETSAADRLIEIAGWVTLTAIWVLVMTQHKNLPEIIPVHYNSAGEADGFGSKEKIFILPVIASIIYTGMTILNRYLHLFPAAVDVTEEIAVRQIKIATRVMRYLKFILVVIFGFILFRTIEHAGDRSEGLGEWFLPLVMVLLFTPVITLIVESVKTTER